MWTLRTVSGSLERVALSPGLCCLEKGNEEIPIPSLGMREGFL